MAEKHYTIEVLFFKGSKTSFIDWFIKFLTWGKYSHVGMILPDGAYWESYPGIGVRVFDFKKIKQSYDTYTIKVSKLELNRITAFLHKQLGKGYDWKGVARFIFRQPIENSDREKWFCSELVFSAFFIAALRLLNDVAYKVSPTLLSNSPLLKLSKKSKK